MLGWQGCPRSCLQPRKDLQVKQEENIIFFTPFTCNATCKVFKIKAKYSVNLFIFLSKKLVKTQKSKPKVLHYLVFLVLTAFIWREKRQVWKISVLSMFFKTCTVAVLTLLSILLSADADCVREEVIFGCVLILKAESKHVLDLQQNVNGAQWE